MAKAKERNRLKLLKYLSDPENDFLSRHDLAVSVLGYKDSSPMYKLMTPSDLIEIEDVAWEERKKRTVRDRAEVYKSLLKVAKTGDVPAIKEYLNRTEGKVTDSVELSGPGGKPIKTEIKIDATITLSEAQSLYDQIVSE